MSRSLEKASEEIRQKKYRGLQKCLNVGLCSSVLSPSFITLTSPTYMKKSIGDRNTLIWQKFNLIALVARMWQGMSMKFSLVVTLLSLAFVLWLSITSNPQITETHTPYLQANASGVSTQVVDMGASGFNRPALFKPQQKAAIATQAVAHTTAGSRGASLTAFQAVQLHHADLVDSTLVGRNLTGAHLFTSPLPSQASAVNVAIHHNGPETEAIH